MGSKAGLSGRSWTWPARREEVLDRGLGLLVGEEGGHHVAVVGGVLTADDHEVAVEDAGTDHRVPSDLQHHELALADQLARQGQQLLDHVVGQGCRYRRQPGRSSVAHRWGSGRGIAATGSWMWTSMARGLVGSRRMKPLR
jgi:hypothetical protein